MAEDRGAMLGFPPVLPDTSERFPIRLPEITYVRVDTNDYSVNPRFVGRPIQVRVELASATVANRVVVVPDVGPPAPEPPIGCRTGDGNPAGIGMLGVRGTSERGPSGGTGRSRGRARRCSEGENGTSRCPSLKGTVALRLAGLATTLSA